MLTGEEVMEIRVLHRQGMSIRGIARTTGISRNVVRRYLRSPEAPRYKRRAPRPSKLDAFKNYVAERLRAAAPSRIPATALLIELRARGYQGGITILKLGHLLHEQGNAVGALNDVPPDALRDELAADDPVDNRMTRGVADLPLDVRLASSLRFSPTAISRRTMTARRARLPRDRP
jgi:transposase